MAQHISMHDLHDRMKKLGQSEIILDVREPEEYSEGHIPGSLNIPVGIVGSRAEELKKYEKVYVHCRSGKRADMAMQVLESKGLKNLVCITDGGMLDWAAAGYPMDHGA